MKSNLKISSLDKERGFFFVLSVVVFLFCLLVFFVGFLKKDIGQKVLFVRHTAQYRFSLTLTNKNLPHFVLFNHFLIQDNISFLFFLDSSLFKCCFDGFI